MAATMDARANWLAIEHSAWLESVQREESKRRNSRRIERRKHVDVSNLRAALGTWAKKTRRGGLTLLKESEKRKLRERLRVELCSDTAVLEILLPSGKQSRLSFSKLDNGREGIYCLNDVAIFIALDSGELIPTVAALIKCPVLLRQLAIFSPVFHNLARGADLFFPGLVGATRVSELPERSKWPEILCGGSFVRGEPVAMVKDGHWAPVAVGFFALDSEDALLRGPTGTVVEALTILDDELWQHFGDINLHQEAQAGAPTRILEALVDVSAIAMQRADRIASLQAERAAAEVAIAAAQELDQLRKDQRRIQKALRQIDDLRNKSNHNADQRMKIEREPSLCAELAATTARLEHILKPPQVEKEAQISEPSGENEEAYQDEPSANEEDLEEEMSQEQVPFEKEEEEGLMKEDHFEAAFLSVVEEYFPRSGRKAKEPVLANEIFGLTARRAGCAVKETKWKKAAKFLEHLDIVETRDRGNGVMLVVSIDWSRAPAFERIEAPPEDNDDDSKLPKPKKKGGRVVVALRRIRNKNCTFVDNLDSWGFSEHDLRDIATNLRSRFSASASVGPRKGTEDNKAGKVFLSIMVQGKYAPQIAHTLKSRMGISDIVVQAPKGMLTKNDRSANVF